MFNEMLAMGAGGGGVNAKIGSYEIVVNQSKTIDLGFNPTVVYWYLNDGNQNYGCGIKDTVNNLERKIGRTGGSTYYNQNVSEITFNNDGTITIDYTSANYGGLTRYWIATDATN